MEKAFDYRGKLRFLVFVHTGQFCIQWSFIHKHCYLDQRKVLPCLWASPEKGSWVRVTEVVDKTMGMSTVYIHSNLHLLPIRATYGKEAWCSPIQSLVLSMGGSLWDCIGTAPGVEQIRSGL